MWPLSLLYGTVHCLRRYAYRRNWLAHHRFTVPVVVVGGITVGGSGKTPLVLYLAQELRAQKLHPGIVSRGYPSRRKAPLEITPHTPARVGGDEAVMLAGRARCPVFIARKRPQAVQALLAAHPEVNIILADDGLQHYALDRSLEIAVVPQRCGNGLLLPAGPLREPLRRLHTVDFIVEHGAPPTAIDTALPARHYMTLVGKNFHHLHDRHRQRSAEQFAGCRLMAVAGIGDPPRFFRHLEALGLAFQSRALPDHYLYRAEDLQDWVDYTLLLTEKDAVKCRALAPRTCDIWVLEVTAQVTPALVPSLLRKLNLHESTTA